jgi:cytochrome P450
MVQERAIEEIERVVGFDRLPSLEDKPNTPYLEAIVCETHRIVSLAFAGIPRLVTKDTSLGGYFIEKVI